jgi:hypothetical protein
MAAGIDNDTIVTILTRLAKIEAALVGPPRDDDPGVGLDERLLPQQPTPKPQSIGPPAPFAPDCEAQDRRLPTSAVAKRYAVVPRSIERWLERADLKFPRPEYINRRRYWSLNQLREWDSARLRASIAER